MSEVAGKVRVGMPVDNRVRMIRISLMRVEHGRDASRQQRWNDEAGDERTPRELHVKFGLWWQCERTVKPPAISNVIYSRCNACYKECRMVSPCSWSARIVMGLWLLILPGAISQTWAQDPAPRPCRFFCSPTLLFEPTMTIENLARSPRIAEGNAPPETELRETIFEPIVALDVPTSVPRLSFTFEVIVHPFVRRSENPFTGKIAAELGGDVRDNPVEIESEINFHWLESEQTGGWVSSHFDVVDQFSPAARPQDRSIYTHKLDFELDTAFAIFKNLKENNWLRDVEVEVSLDYLASGRPKAGDQFGDVRFVDDASPWSLSFVVVIPIIRGQ